MLRSIAWVLLLALGGRICAQWDMMDISDWGDMELPGMSMPEDWAQRLYAGVTGGYMNSRDFDGGGGSATLGYDLGSGHSLDVEFNFWFEQANKNVQTAYGPLQLTSGGPISKQQVAIYTNTRVNFNQFPILFNYRYTLNGSGGWKDFSVFLGIGVGVNIIHWQQTTDEDLRISAINANGYTTIGSTSNQQSQTTAAFAGQGFAGLGVRLTQQFSLMMRARVLGTQQFSFGGTPLPMVSPQSSTPLLKTSTAHWSIEGGALFRF